MSIESIWTPKIQIKYIDTKNQLADMLTKGNFTRDEWSHLLCLFNISHFSSTDCSDVMSKRTQEESGEERVTAKSKPMMNLVSRCSERTPDVLASTASESPRYNQLMKANYLWACGLSSILRTGGLALRTLTHQVPLRVAMLTKNGLKSGNPDEVMEVRTGDLLMNNHPVCSHSTRTDFVVDDDDIGL